MTPASTSALAAGFLARTWQDRRRAWVPWVMLGLIVFLWGLPQVKGFLNDIYSASVSVPFLDLEVVRVPPVVAKPSPSTAVTVRLAVNRREPAGTRQLRVRARGASGRAAGAAR